MSERVERGDLVMVVKPYTCCGWTGSIGHVHRVTDFHRAVVCTKCHQRTVTTVAIVDDRWEAYELEILKRIPPLTEPTPSTMKEVA